MRLLIVNADDLGYDPEIDRGILEAHEKGIVTSCTAMVDTPFAPAALGSVPQSLGVGLHVVLPGAVDPGAIAAEVRRQVELFARWRGGPPTHLDSHRHAHASPAALAAFIEVAVERQIPVRSLDAAMRAALRAAGVRTSDAFLGDAALRPCWTLARLLGSLESLPEGTTEIMAHPGYPPRFARTSFGAEREVELRALCDPAARQALERAGARLAFWAA